MSSAQLKVNAQNVIDTVAENSQSLLQFEWPQFGGNAYTSRFSQGPAPSTPTDGEPNAERIEGARSC